MLVVVGGGGRSVRGIACESASGSAVGFARFDVEGWVCACAFGILALTPALAPGKKVGIVCVNGVDPSICCMIWYIHDICPCCPGYCPDGWLCPGCPRCPE